MSVRARSLLSLLLLAATCWLATASLARTSEDETDELEWTVISVAHWRQLRGATPPGVELDEAAGRLHEDRWRQGVQATTFGWPNPGFLKCVWGLLCDPVAPEVVDPRAFYRYSGGDPRIVAEAAAPWESAIERARALVAAASAACALWLFLIARRAAGGVAGFVAALLWLLHPMTREWSHYARPDFVMLWLALVAMHLALLLSDRSPSDEGVRLRWPLVAALGLAVGLAAATKLNGALAGVGVALALPLAAVGAGRAFGWRTLGIAGGLAGLLSLLVFWSCFPYLWTSPGEHLGEVLAFWEKHMAFQQERWLAAGGRVARDWGEGLELLRARSLGSEEPLTAVLGLPLPGLWAVAGFLGAALVAWRGEPGRRLAARQLLLLALVLLIGTGAWLPLEWDRYFFAPLAAIVLLEACALGGLARLGIARWQGRAQRQGRARAETQCGPSGSTPPPA